ncbi:MAG TPA: hypothetical protein VJ327_11000 [Patescibacteria group bacterium]|nr:hypothetical protein [Patescibacteria group bacterium]
MMLKTIPVSENAHRTIKKWCRAKGMTFEQFFDSWIEHVANKKQQQFYDSLPDPRKLKNVKPLENVKIDKFYKK